MFPNGTPIDSTVAAGASGHLADLLDAGTYYVEVTHGDTAVASHVLAATYGNFSLSIRAARPTGGTAPKEGADFGAFDAATGGVQEPTINASGTPSGSAYQDFSSDPLFGSGGPSPDDVLQQTCGDCYFLAALSAIARTDPSVIQADVQQTGPDQYRVKFARNGQDDWISVDGQLPALNGSPVYADIPADGAIWVPIMEKAFCYFRNPQNVSYASIEGGFSDEVFQDLGGTVTTYTRTALRNGAGLTNAINTLLTAGDAVTLGTQAANTTSIISGHVYSVVTTGASNTVELRNPWGVNPVNATNPEGTVNNDGGYITLNNTAVFNDTDLVWGATFPNVTNVPPPPPPVTLSASVSGTVFNDVNNDQTFDVGDPGLAGVTVYATTASHGAFANGDPYAITDANGSFTIYGITPGVTYYYYEITPSGWVNSKGNGAGWYSTLSAGDHGTGYDFGNQPASPSTSSIADINGYLGADSFTLRNGSLVDAYAGVAQSTGYTALAIQTSYGQNFAPAVEVLEFSPNGTETNYWVDPNYANNSTTFLAFATHAGDTYEIVIASKTGALGGYTLAYDASVLSGVQQLSPN